MDVLTTNWIGYKQRIAPSDRVFSLWLVPIEAATGLGAQLSVSNYEPWL
jgi:hypothetical protein